jgi:hypothetical protein
MNWFMLRNFGAYGDLYIQWVCRSCRYEDDDSEVVHQSRDQPSNVQCCNRCGHSDEV